MRLLHLVDGEFKVILAQSQNLHIVGVLNLELYGERLVVGRRCCHLDTLGVHVVLDDDCRVG